MSTVTAVLVGAGQRGLFAYGGYALDHPEEFTYVAVAEPDPQRRALFAERFGVPAEKCYETWEELFAQPKLADAAVICTPDNLHYAPAQAAAAAGYDLLLEKPMSKDPAECMDIAAWPEKYGVTVTVCHVLRYTTFFTTIKRLLDSGRIGQLISVDLNENIAFWHFAHSFVRGIWRRSDETSPVILAKSCHDLDLLRWLVDAPCTSVASYGSLSHFTSEHAPAGATPRCLDCPVADCPYSAVRIYGIAPKGSWPRTALTLDEEAYPVEQALREGPYGRCVYFCDNDVPDHQVVGLEFANQVTATFTLSAFTLPMSRTIKLMGSRGEIRGDMDTDRLEVADFMAFSTEVIQLEPTQMGHGDGDEGIMRDFIARVSSRGGTEALTSAQASVESHLMALAAEASRLEHRMVTLAEFAPAA